MDKTIKLEHYYISFFDRMKYYILMLIGVISIFVIFTFIDGQAMNFPLLFAVLILVLGSYVAIKIYRNRYFLTDFYSDSHKIAITYLLYSKEIKLESTLDELSVIVKNTSSRSGFDCEVILCVENKLFYLNKDFNWGLLDLKKLVDYLKFYKDLDLTAKEKFTLERLDEKLKEIPF